MPTCAGPASTVFEVLVLEQGFGFTALEVRGRGVAEFDAEAGGHRWQRVPPTEKRGRVHTSTVTVAVLRPSTASLLDEREVEFRTERGTGPGGQHRNKTESKVVATHRPTGIQAASDGRSQHANREAALRVLSARVAAHLASASSVAHNGARRAQIGSGERGDKVRTYRVRDDRWTDHRNGAGGRVSDWLAGKTTRPSTSPTR